MQIDQNKDDSLQDALILSTAGSTLMLNWISLIKNKPVEAAKFFNWLLNAVLYYISLISTCDNLASSG